jgi:hypothetical protein
VQESWRTVKMTSTSFPKLIKPWWFLKKMRQLAGIEQNPDWELSKRFNLYLLVCVVRWWIFSFRVVNVHSQIKSKNKNNIYIYIHRMWRRIWDGALYAFTSQDPVKVSVLLSFIFTFLRMCCRMVWVEKNPELWFVWKPNNLDPLFF